MPDLKSYLNCSMRPRHLRWALWLSRLRHTVTTCVIGVLNECYWSVRGLLLDYPRGVTVVLLELYMIVTGVSQGCHSNSATGVLHDSKVAQI